MKLVPNEKGVTLVEILAAVVILTIILLSIMNFFPQIAGINNSNEDKSQAINTAKQELIFWQKSGEDYLVSGTLPPGWSKLQDTLISGEDYNHLQSTERDFKVDIFIKKNPDFPTNTDPNATKIYRLKVQLSNTKGTVITETYGYITL